MVRQIGHKFEVCAYKQLNYFNDCGNCSGKNLDRMCYVTSHDLQLHLKGFNQMFRATVRERIIPIDEEALDRIGTLESIGLEVWE